MIVNKQQTNKMEDLTQLMALIDENSKILPEGDYLKMCNTMKNIFNKTSRSTPPTVVPQRAPFAVYHIPESDLESDSGSDSGDLPFIEYETDFLDSFDGELDEIRREFESMGRIRRNITSVVRRSAIADAERRYGVEFPLNDAARGLWIPHSEWLRFQSELPYHISTQGHFYRNYLDKVNDSIRRRMNELMESAMSINESLASYSEEDADMFSSDDRTIHITRACLTRSRARRLINSIRQALR
jgi:hypothetical protein